MSKSQEELYNLYLRNIYNAIDGEVIGGAFYSNRKLKGDLDVNVHLLSAIRTRLDSMVVGNEYLKGMVFHDCDLTGNDMDYLMNMPDWVDYYFKIIDFSNNPGINDLGIYYALRGNIGHDDGIKYKGFLGRDRLHVETINLSNCNIGDKGAALIAEALSDGKLVITKLLNLGGNQITSEGFQNIMDIISHIDQEIFIITEKNESVGEGKAIFKSTDGHLYDFKLTSDGKECAVEFGDGITGISGISTGDTCPPSVRSQIGACVGGASAGALSGVEFCKATKGKGKLVCYANKILAGCAYGVAATIGDKCVSGNEYKYHDKGDFSFSATGGTEIQGSYIDNSRGPMGSSFDLSQHDF